MRISIEKKIVTTQKTQIKPSFKSVDSFTHIKEIPGMVCAICGKPTLSTEKYAKVIVPLSRSLAYNMSKGVLDYLSRKYAHHQLKSLEDYENWKESYDAKSKSQSQFVKERLMRNVDMYSNGESAMKYFVDHISENALYLLDDLG